MNIDEYIHTKIEKLVDIITLIKEGKYTKANNRLLDTYEDLQTTLPKNIPEIYFRQDRIGYSRWKNIELSAIGKASQKILIFLDKKEFIDSNIVISYIEGSDNMMALANIETTDTLKAMTVLYGIIYAYSA